MSLQNFLDEIYIKFGLYMEDLHSLTPKGIEGSEKIKLIMEELRKNLPGNFGDLKVKELHDIENLTRKDMTASGGTTA